MPEPVEALPSAIWTRVSLRELIESRLLGRPRTVVVDREARIGMAHLALKSEHVLDMAGISSDRQSGLMRRKLGYKH